MSVIIGVDSKHTHTHTISEALEADGSGIRRDDRKEQQPQEKKQDILLLLILHLTDQSSCMSIQKSHNTVLNSHVSML